MAIRLALLAHHYRTDWEWTADQLTAAEARLARWRSAAALQAGPEAGTVLDRVRARIADDLDTPGALTAIDDWAERALSADGADGTDPRAPMLVRDIADALLGISL